MRALIGLINNNIKHSAVSGQIVDSAKGYRYLGAAFYIIFGLFMLAFTSYLYATNQWNPGASLFLGMGILFLAFGLIALRKAIQLAKIQR